MVREDDDTHITTSLTLDEELEREYQKIIEKQRGQRNTVLAILSAIASVVVVGTYIGYKGANPDDMVNDFTHNLALDITDGTLDTSIAGRYGAGHLIIDGHLYRQLDTRTINKKRFGKLRADRRDAYEEAFDTLVAHLETLPGFDDPARKDDIERNKELFRWIQTNLVAEYSPHIFDMGFTLEDSQRKRHNCNGSTQLHMALWMDATKLGYVNADHMRVIAFDADRTMPKEKQFGHVLLGFAGTDQDGAFSIPHFFENTNPLNVQLPEYNEGRVLTVEQYFSGYLMGMGLDSWAVHDLAHSLLDERFGYEDVEAYVDLVVAHRLEERDELRRTNKKIPLSKRRTTDPYILPPVGVSFTPSDPDSFEYVPQAELALVFGMNDYEDDLEELTYKVSVAVQRRQMDHEDLAAALEIIESHHAGLEPAYKQEGDLHARILSRVGDFETQDEALADEEFMALIGDLCLDPANHRSKSHKRMLQEIMVATYRLEAGDPDAYIDRAQLFFSHQPTASDVALADIHIYRSRVDTDTQATQSLLESYGIEGDIYVYKAWQLKKDRTYDRGAVEALYRKAIEAYSTQLELIDDVPMNRHVANALRSDVHLNLAKIWISFPDEGSEERAANLALALPYLHTATNFTVDYEQLRELDKQYVVVDPSYSIKNNKPSPAAQRAVALRRRGLLKGFEQN